MAILRLFLQLTLGLALVACTKPPPKDSPDSSQGGDMSEPEPPPPPSFCEQQSFPERTLDTTGPFGIDRHDIADDFSVELLDNSSWVLNEQWTGCEVYLFIPNQRPNSALDDTSLWARDLDLLLQKSPTNVHYFFVAARNADDAASELADMQLRIDEALVSLDADTSAWWKQRLHVVAKHRSLLDGWLRQILSAYGGYYGFAIDRHQQVRFLGSYADVSRYKSELKAADEWPWEANLSYAAHDARQYNYEAVRDAALSAEENVTIVSPWSQEVLKGTVEVDFTLPDAAAMAEFDTFEIDLTMDCSDPAKGEFGNCGAWDYLAPLYLQDAVDDTKWIELARYITTYHREGRYLVDATAMLSKLRDGGTRKLRFVISPSWNEQAYLTQMDFRFSNRGKAYRPSSATFLWNGGALNSTYNDNFAAVEVAIPATAKRVELWAIITGHGMDTFNCAEFCNHQHYFTVNGVTYTKEHPESNQQEGCIDQIENGMVPNQGGTWWFGRGGWCPGQQVDPWVVDVTADVTLGETATVTYEAKLNGNPLSDNLGNIEMSSQLVVYE